MLLSLSDRESHYPAKRGASRKLGFDPLPVYQEFATYSGAYSVWVAFAKLVMPKTISSHRPTADRNVNLSRFGADRRCLRKEPTCRKIEAARVTLRQEPVLSIRLQKRCERSDKPIIDEARIILGGHIGSRQKISTWYQLAAYPRSRS